MTGTEVIIVDDDHIAGSLSDEILRAEGFTTGLISDGRLALQAIREQRPRAVLLDILMPGIDGLSLCRAIKSDPEIKDIKVIIVSGKSFPAEKERAAKFGADLFIEKPYGVDSFAERVKDLVGPPRQAPAGAAGRVARTVDVRIWGARSEGASSDPKARTPCVSVEASGRLFVFDAGTGITFLGNDPATAKFQDIWILLTHFHPAHVQGLGLFAPTRAAGVALTIAGPNDPEKSLDDCVRENLELSFHVDRRPAEAAMRLVNLESGEYDPIPGVKLKTLFANHPTTTLAYSLETLGKRIVYCPDSELYGEGATALQDYDERLGNFCRGADVLIHDARYSTEDYSGHKNHGHCSAAAAADLAARHDVARLVLFHMDASYGGDLSKLETEAQEAVRAAGGHTECRLGLEGSTVTL